MRSYAKLPEGGAKAMTTESSDDVVRHARELRAQQIQDCSRRAAQKIAAKIKAGKISTETLAEIIVGEFEELKG
jgi:F0F1-type ATP synthase assembly protein I